MSRGQAEQHHLKEASRLATVWRQASSYDHHIRQAWLNRVWRLHTDLGDPASIGQTVTPDAMASLRAAIEQDADSYRRFDRRMRLVSLAVGGVAWVTVAAYAFHTWGWL